MWRIRSSSRGSVLVASDLTGYAAVTDWEPLLPEDYAVSHEGLVHQGRLMLHADRTALTQLALGYRSVDDLLLIPGCVLMGGEAVRTHLAHDFPPTLPKWWLAPFWL